MKEHGTMIGNQHKVAFYADIFYNSELSPAYWTPPANLDAAGDGPGHVNPEFAESYAVEL
jgi:hypothetical protein